MDPAMERFMRILETKLEVIEEAKGWVQKVKPKWHPPEGLFTKSAKEIAEYLAKASPDYATAVRRAVFYYNRAGVCNKGGPRFDEKECRKACRVLKLLRKLFGVAEKDRSESEVKYCEAVNEGLEVEDEPNLDALLEAADRLLKLAVDYSPEVLVPSDVSPDALAEYEDILMKALGPNLVREDGLTATVSDGQLGVYIVFEWPGAYIYFPGEFEFPPEVDTDGISLSYNVSDLTYLDSRADERPRDEKEAAINAILAAIGKLELDDNYTVPEEG